MSGCRAVLGSVAPPRGDKMKPFLRVWGALVMIGSLIYRCSWSSVIRPCQCRPAASSLPPCWGPAVVLRVSCVDFQLLVSGSLQIPGPDLHIDCFHWSSSFTAALQTCSSPQSCLLVVHLKSPSVQYLCLQAEFSGSPVLVWSGEPPTLLTLLSWCHPFLLSPLVFPSLLAFLFSSVIF